jgi:hypothetical protein
MIGQASMQGLQCSTPASDVITAGLECGSDTVHHDSILP